MSTQIFVHKCSLFIITQKWKQSKRLLINTKNIHIPYSQIPASLTNRILLLSALPSGIPLPPLKGNSEFYVNHSLIFLPI